MRQSEWIPWCIFNAYLLTLEDEHFAEGAQGKIFLAQLCFGDRTIDAAVKELISTEAERVPLEFQLHKKLTHAKTTHESGILKLLGVHVPSENIYWGILPKCQFSLHQAMPVIIQLSTQSDPESQALYQKILFGFFCSMLRALNTLAQAKIVHCDLKPDNVLLSPDESSNGLVNWCAADFGSALPESKKEEMMLRGTLKSMAPEALTDNRHTVSSDIWSVAHMLITMLNLPKSEASDAGDAGVPMLKLTLRHIDRQNTVKKKVLANASSLKRAAILQATLFQKNITSAPVLARSATTLLTTGAFRVTHDAFQSQSRLSIL